jgi:hypothetical protein
VIGARQNWRERAIWLMLAVSACWVVYVFGANYNGCRKYGFGEVVCLVWTLLLSGIEVFFFVIAALARIVGLILP